MLRLLLPLLLFSVCIAEAQNEKSHWYFGARGTGIRFENGEPKADTNSDMNSYIGSVSISDSSGNLLFYSNGSAFFNKNHKTMDGSTGLNVGLSKDAIALPSPQERGIYFVYSVDIDRIYQYKIDMNANGGLGQVRSVGEFYPFDGQYVETVTAIKDCESNGFWLVTIKNITGRSQLVSMKVDLESGRLSRRNTLLLDKEISYPTWSMITSPDGEYIALVNNHDAYLIQFDATCGKFKGVELLQLPNTGTSPKGACFSPEGTYLYVSTAKRKEEKEGYLYQIDYRNLTDPDVFKNFQKVNYALYSMLNGPDNRMYILTHFETADLRGIDRVRNPDAVWSDVSYEAKALTFPHTTLLLPYLPNFITDTRDCSKEITPSFKSTGFCAGDSLRFQFSNLTGYDSIYLIDLDQGKPFLIDNLRDPILAPKPQGTYNFKLTWRMCAMEQRELDLKIQILNYPKSSQVDTLICTGDSLILAPIDPAYTREVFLLKEGQWNATASVNLAEQGTYKIEASNGSCLSKDRFELNLVPPLLTSLGDSFAFCEEEGVPVLLDAGKGFEGYLWFPTNDSTQWISVREQGDYYVVVNDSRGCKGRDDAKVVSDCQPKLFIPNAFSPDGNGANDSFYIEGKYFVPQTIRVYDRWGALVHYANGPKMAWNGAKNGALLPKGMYFYILNYEAEFTNKAYTISGPIYLLR